MWGEVQSDAKRYDASSQILQSIDKVGFLFLRQNNGTSNFTFNRLAVTLKNETTDKNSWSCFEFPSNGYGGSVGTDRNENSVPSGKICIPKNTKQGLSVASALQFNNKQGRAPLSFVLQRPTNKPLHHHWPVQQQQVTCRSPKRIASSANHFLSGGLSDI